MSLANFTYHYTLPPASTETQLTDIYPDGGDISIEVERDGFRYRKQVSNSFKAIKSSYTALKGLLDANSCDEVSLVIKLNGSEFYTGQLNLKKATWNPDQCTVSFSLDAKDDYYCLESEWEDEVNIFTIGSEVSAEPFFGTLTEVTCGPVNNSTPVQITGYFEQNVSGCLADLDAYEHKRLYIEEVSPTSYNHYATWVTEQATTTCSGGVPVSPPGSGWVLLVNDCAGTGTATWGRKPQVKFQVEQSGDTGKYWDYLYSVVGSDATAYDNGRLLSDILSSLVFGCGLTVKSDFFNINADATAPSNSAYTASVALHSLILYQKTDIKLPEATEAATIAFIKLKDLLSYLQSMFQVYWDIRDSGNTIRIEHISYFDGVNGDDLTSTQPLLVEKKNGFSFDTNNLKPQDEFSWMDETTDPDFRGLPISYPTGCVDSTSEPNSIRVQDIFTDLGTVNAAPETINDNGFFLMATDEVSGTYYINREEGEISAEIKPNAHLAWANLHENYLSWGRPLPSGTLNNVSQSFNSYVKSKKQEEIRVIYQHSDFLTIDFNSKFKTGLGWGEVESASYSCKSCILTLNLLHND